MKTQTSKELIVVLGMHRSGTSVITRALKVLNVDLGNNLLGPKEADNEKGFFEDVDINLFDRELEKALNRDWYYLGPITEQDVAFLCEHGFFEKAEKLLLSKVKDSRIFGFKDPRITKFLPFWKKVFDHCGLSVKYLLTIRNPISVAKSLRKRDDMSIEKSYLLWLTHLIPCLKCLSSEEKSIVDYDLLMASPEKELKRIAKNLNLTIHPIELEKFLAGFLDINLRHDLSSEKDLLANSDCHPLVTEIYTSLLNESKGTKKQSSLPIETINSWLAEFERMKSCFVLADKLDSSIRDKERNLASQSDELNAKSLEIDHLMIYQKAKDQHIHHLKVEVAAKDQHIHHLKVEIKAKDQHIHHLKAEINTQNEQINQQNTELVNINQELNRIYESLSWKITSPLRAARSFLNRLLK